jgi:hypothetical protein
MSSISIVINKLSTTASCGCLSDAPPMMIDMCGHHWKDNGKGKTVVLEDDAASVLLFWN